MDLDTYHKLVNKEDSARKYLTKKCRKNGRRFCPRCKHQKLYKLASGRRRCANCKYTFHDFSGRWINHGRLSCIQWLSIIKLFELELSVRKMAEQMGLAYNTVYQAVHTIRRSIRPMLMMPVSFWVVKSNSTNAILEVDAKATEVAVPPVKFQYLVS